MRFIWPYGHIKRTGTLSRGCVGEEGGDEAVDVVALGFDVDLEAGVGGGLAGHGADRDDAGGAREAVAERLGQVAHGRGRGEGDVVGGLGGLDRLGAGLLAHGLVEGDDVDLGAAAARGARG